MPRPPGYVYLDHAATTPLSPEVRRGLEPLLGEDFANPSSTHPAGLVAARHLEDARNRVARALCLGPQDRVIFTSGGTEANNLAVLGAARARRRRGRRVVIGPTEHPSVRAAGEALGREGFEVRTLRLVSGGPLDLEDLRGHLDEEVVLVALMLVNNELGSRYPVEEVVRATRAEAPHAHVHVDAVQAFGKLEVLFHAIGADSLAISGHKIGGLKGAGALALARGSRLKPLLFGGGQEGGLRPGTENTVGIAALGLAAERAAHRWKETAAHLSELRRVLAEALESTPGVRVLTVPGSPPRPDRPSWSPSIAALQVSGPPAEAWMHHLEERGVLTSAGSACQAKAKTVSPALLALGLDAEGARRVLRWSFGPETTLEEVERAAEALREVAVAMGGAAGSRR